MKLLQMKQNENVYTILDETTPIYTIEYAVKAGTLSLELKNAYNEQVITLRVSHSGFKLLRTNKIASMKLQMMGQDGEITPRDNSYEWSLNDVNYTFVCGELSGSDALIMSDHEETLGYASSEGIVLHHAMYGAELCMFYSYLLVSSDKVQLDQEKFKRAWVQVHS